MAEEFEIPSKVYDAEFNLTWQAVLDIMQKYDLAQKNQEIGLIKTRWKDNTQELNFQDSFSVGDAVKAAKFKLILNVVKGYKGEREVTKVTVFKRQMVEKDFLQGWKVVPTDGISEQAILYRISRLLAIELNLKKIEAKRVSEQEKDL